jgi:hypothetical protein
MLKNILLLFLIIVVIAKAQNISELMDGTNVDWSSTTDVATGTNENFSSLSSEYISDNGYYDSSYSAPSYDHVYQYVNDFEYTVPVGVSSVRVHMATLDQEFGFTLSVAVNDLLQFNFDYETCASGPSIDFQINNGGQAVFVPGTGSGCTGDLSYTGIALSPNSYYSLGNTWVSLSLNNSCPEYYTNLKSDFDPTLNVADSSLYMNQGSPELRIVFDLPAYYYDVFATHLECSGLDPQVFYQVNGCTTTYFTSIDYTDSRCTFNLDSNYLNGSDTVYAYYGALNVSASLDLNVGGFAITRHVSSPINWRVLLQQTITVSSNINVDNNATCTQDSDCNGGQYDENGQNNGCCSEDTDGFKKCDCTCISSAEGYSGKFCQQDTLKAKCELVDPANSANTAELSTQITLQSTHGGCVKFNSTFLTSKKSSLVPTFSDNSNSFWVERVVTINGGTPSPVEYGVFHSNSTMSSIEGFLDDCYPVGTHVIVWNVQDVPHTDTAANGVATCTVTLVVEDAEAPFVDCQQCQGSNLDHGITLCVGSDESSLSSGNYTADQARTLFGEDQTNEVYYPGSASPNGYVDCDCLFENGGSAPLPTFYTSNWGSWGAIMAYDLHTTPQNLQLTYPPSRTESDGEFDGSLSYNATDLSSNLGHCIISVVYDFSPPTCTGFEDLEVATNSTNYNYSVTVIFDVTGYGTNYSKSGANPNATLAGPTLLAIDDEIGVPYSGQEFYVGGNYNMSYETKYKVVDRAGNIGFCPWKILVKNPDPCIFVNGTLTTPNAANCDDLDPVLTPNTCNTTTHVIECKDTGSCGCGSWTPPSFTDDKYVAYINVTYNGNVIAHYDNNLVSLLPGVTEMPEDRQLSVGTHMFAYQAFDMHGQSSAVCTITVQIKDTIAPVTSSTSTPLVNNQTTGCPVDQTLNVTAGTDSASYSYSLVFEDECGLNLAVSYNGGQSGQNLTTGNGVDTITAPASITGRDFNYFYYISDDQGNHAYCAWTITINDNEDPVVTCRSNYTVRIPQGQEYVLANLTDGLSTATDNVGVFNAYYDTVQDQDQLVAGEYVINFKAYDYYGNSASCPVKITVEAPTPVAYFKPALTYVRVHKSSPFGAGTSYPFGADITLTTLVNLHHRVRTIPNAFSLVTGTNDNSDIHNVGNIGQTLDHPFTETNSCGSEDAICAQSFEFKAGFTDCVATVKRYEFSANVKCTRTGCTEAHQSFDVNITLAASNYCWQDLADISVTASMITVDKTVADTYFSTGWTYGNAGLPDHKHAFTKGDNITGIITVGSPNININSVSIVRSNPSNPPQSYYVKREFYSDATYTGDALETHMSGTNLDYSTYSKADACGFSYTEDQLDFKETIYVKYYATVEIVYQHGGNRRLLQVNSGDSNSKQVTAEAAIRSRDVADNVDPTTAIVVMMINDCDENNNGYNDQFVYTIAKYLHIDINRVSVNIDATSDGYCLAEVTIQQANCAGTTSMATLIAYLQDGIADEYSDLHSYFATEVNNEVILDTNVFFVSQSPQDLYAVSASSSTNSSADSGLEWYYYVACGAIVGILLVSGVYNTCASKKSDEVKHMPLQGERRYSIADLLAATERRSSIDIANVKLHSAF